MSLPALMWVLAFIAKSPVPVETVFHFLTSVNLVSHSGTVKGELPKTKSERPMACPSTRECASSGTNLALPDVLGASQFQHRGVSHGPASTDFLGGVKASIDSFSMD